MKTPRSLEDITLEHIDYMLDTIEKRTRGAVGPSGLLMIQTHDFEVLMKYARVTLDLMRRSLTKGPIA